MVKTGAGVSALASVAFFIEAGVRIWSPTPQPARRSDRQKRPMERVWSPFTNPAADRSSNLIELNPDGI